jgi:hypothetical protein
MKGVGVGVAAIASPVPLTLAAELEMSIWQFKTQPLATTMHGKSMFDNLIVSRLQQFVQQSQ